MPLIMGMLVWFIMRALKASLNKVPFIRTYFPSWLKSLLSSAIILFLLVSLINILSQNMASLSRSYALYQPNVDAVIASINDRFNLNIVEMLQKQMGDFDFGNLLSSVLSSLSEMVGNTFMIAIYALFIVLEESNFNTKLRKMFAKPSTYEETMSILAKIDTSVSNYLRLKTFVSLITGIVSYVALRIIDVDSPEFWAFLIFLLNFIPTIGSLVGTVFPAVFALLQFGELAPFIYVLLLVGAVQLVVGNLIEPRLMGSSMNISPLVTILALSLWGVLWGVMGMILSVPITVMLIIIFSHFEKTRTIAILLSEKGEV